VPKVLSSVAVLITPRDPLFASHNGRTLPVSSVKLEVPKEERSDLGGNCMRRLAPLVIVTFLALPAFAGSSGSHGATRSTSVKTSKRSSSGHLSANTTKCTPCARDAKAMRSFQKSHPCPSTGRTTGPCEGYVINHIQPFETGGAASPSNMRWQGVAAAKAKDK
jgi:hypothetical protein